MDWGAQIDGYCERIDPSFWAEPVNAMTNAAFVVAALWMVMRLQERRAPGMAVADVLAGILALIGVGSFLFHTYATSWAAVADVVPIALFVLVYIYGANRHFLALSWPLALGATALFFPYAAVTIPLFQKLPLLGVSAGYLPVPVMIAAYAVGLRNRNPEVARGLGIGAAVLMISLTFRSLDMVTCAAFPLGTHFLWHVLNGVMLGWMIEVLRRHLLRANRSG